MEEFQELNDTEESGFEESAVVKEIRNRNRALEKKLDALMAEKAESDVAAQTQRAEVAQEIMNTFGLPDLTEDVLQWVPEEVSRETVYAALEARGIPVPEEGAVQPKTETPVESVSASNVGQRVADIAAGNDTRSVDERIASASSPAELQETMSEAGLVRNHS